MEWLPQDIPMCQPSECVNVAIYGKKEGGKGEGAVFIDIIKALMMEGYPGLGVGLKCNHMSL